ncbi:MAG: hypothetical protein HQL45_17350 [Alphaproteobacteria bacterium]|nr:hypothetical protein [Alphaproteobacteria bacterium]
MTCKRKIQAGLLAIALLAVAAAGSLFWFNWWIRNSWTRIYPICHDGDTLVQFTKPLTEEAFELYASYMTKSNKRGYSFRVGDAIYVKRGYWLFGDGEHLQITRLMNDGLARARALKEGGGIHCSEIAELGTLSRDRWYTSEYYPPNWVRDNLERVSFHVLAERFGTYTPFGEFLRQFETTDDKPDS